MSNGAIRYLILTLLVMRCLYEVTNEFRHVAVQRKTEEKTAMKSSIGRSWDPKAGVGREGSHGPGEIADLSIGVTWLMKEIGDDAGSDAVFDGVFKRTSLRDLDPGSHHWYLGVCASALKPTPWLREWIEVLLISGVGHIWLIIETPEAHAAVREYEERGFVTTFDFSKITVRASPACGSSSECIHERLCHKLTHRYVDQFILAKTDEFYYPLIGCDLTSHLQKHCSLAHSHQHLHVEAFDASFGVGTLWDQLSTSIYDNYSRIMYNAHCVSRIDSLATNDLRQGCVAMTFEEQQKGCKKYVQFGGGSVHPAEGSEDCCVAGVGVNKYIDGGGTSGTVSFGITRIFRAVAERFKVLGIGTSMFGRGYIRRHIDEKEVEKSTYIEEGWFYDPDRTVPVKLRTYYNASVELCDAICWSTIRNKRRCSSWSFHASTGTCIHAISPYTHKAYKRWPQSTFAAYRIKNAAYTSGFPLHDEDCPLPDRLKTW